MSTKKHNIKELKTAMPTSTTQTAELRELRSQQMQHGGGGAMEVALEHLKRFTELADAIAALRAPGDRPAIASGKSTFHFDPDKMQVEYVSGAQADRDATKAVLNTLKIRAQSAGISFNEKGRFGREIASLRWLFPEVARLKSKFAAEIEQHLQELMKPAARREVLVSMILRVIPCIRACNTILFGEESATDVPAAAPAIQAPLSPAEMEEYKSIFEVWMQSGVTGAKPLPSGQIDRFCQLSDRIPNAQRAS